MDAVLELIWSCSYGSTTIDQICDKAGVRKGSFYYYFESKADLAVTAIEAQWQKHRAESDSLFSPTVPPLQRLKNYFDMGHRFQSEIKQKYGHVLGCPLFSLGSEVCTQEHALQKKIQEILSYKLKYLESAIRDAHAAGLIDAPDAAAKARMIHAYYEGLLTQARIQDDVEVLREAAPGAFAILGMKVPGMVAA
ncbi:MAG TPA: TetR/AcrR family transcriptional regulator [Candidatus Limnocylindrales bacterium]|jgi:TetR/AcrR family transcriptional regulator, transcriptional repressor for nem operon|nr:TetR/AcrR family transcriptional regulator [Candidatus Limnocylindrales bacterium]